MWFFFRKNLEMFFFLLESINVLFLFDFVLYNLFWELFKS